MQLAVAQLSNVLAYDSPLIGQSVGMIVVFAALSLIAVIVAGVGKYMVARDAKLKAQEAAAKAAAAPAAPAAAKAAVTAPAARNGLTPELVAVIAAAVDTALDGRSHRILDIKQKAATAWALSGRTEIYASHRLR